MSQITDVILSNKASDKFYSVNKDGKISVSEFDDEWSTFEMKYLDDFEQKGMRVFDYIPKFDLVFYVLDRDPFGFMWNVATKESAGNDSLKGECKLYNQDIIGMKHIVYGKYRVTYLVVIQRAYVRVYSVNVLASAVVVDCLFVEPTNRILPSQVAVTANRDEMVLAHCPWSNEATQKNIQITTYNHFKENNKSAFDIVVALGGISYIALNSNGSKMAYADTEGQNIRVYDLKKPMDPPKQFYRGSRPVTMLSMVFDSASKYLACSSNSQTVHVFKLQHDVASSAGVASAGIVSSVAGIASSVWDLGNYVYTVGTTLQTHEVSFAQIHVAIGYADDKLVIREEAKVHGFVKNAAGDLGLAVSFRQIIDIYKIDEQVGKECIRVLEHSVLDSVLVDK